MNRLLFLLATIATVSADVNCFNGDILRKGNVLTPGSDEAKGCRIHFEMMNSDKCDETQVDIVAGRTGSAANETLECEYLTGDNMVECECATDKCNIPSMILKKSIEDIMGASESEKAIINCFLKVLENKFGLTTTTTTTTTATTTTTPTTTTEAKTTEKATSPAGTTDKTKGASTSHLIMAASMIAVPFIL